MVVFWVRFLALVSMIAILSIPVVAHNAITAQSKGAKSPSSARTTAETAIRRPALP